MIIIATKFKIINMSKMILKELGTTTKKYSFYLIPKGESFDETYYEESELKIIESGYHNNDKIACIYYKGQKVFDKKNYTPGKWEDLLEEIYNRIISKNKRKKIIKKRKRIKLIKD